jgi:hypothetical protein
MECSYEFVHILATKTVAHNQMQNWHSIGIYFKFFIELCGLILLSNF